MNQEYYNSLANQHGSTPLQSLPLPTNRVPVTAEQYDYKTYWTSRYNQKFNQGTSKRR
jgi:hypothetical protein